MYVHFKINFKLFNKAISLGCFSIFTTEQFQYRFQTNVECGLKVL